MLSSADRGRSDRASGALRDGLDDEEEEAGTEQRREEADDEAAVAVDAGDVVVAVQDECGGIPADVIGRVFETGYRGTAARSPGEGRGSGLGLAIVAGVAAAHGGSARVTNAGNGCRFTLRLPA